MLSCEDNLWGVCDWGSVCVCVKITNSQQCWFHQSAWVIDLYTDKNVSLTSFIGLLMPPFKASSCFYNQLTCVSRFLDIRSIRVGGLFGLNVCAHMCGLNQGRAVVESWEHQPIGGMTTYITIYKILPNQSKIYKMYYVIYFQIIE